MDITEFNIEAGVDSSSGLERIKPGRYNLEYKGSDDVQNAAGWRGIKVMFAVEGEILNVSHQFTMVNPNSEKQAEIGKKSLALMFKAMGVTTIKNTDDLVNKKVSVELDYNAKGYLEIKDDFGKGWAEATKPGVKPAPVVDETEMFPPDAEDDESDMPF